MDVCTISYHLKKIFEDREMEEKSVIQFFRITAADCRTPLCFVYDAEGHCKIPVALKSDLTETAADFSVLVVVALKGK